MDQVARGRDVRSPDGRTPQQASPEVRERVLDAAARARRSSGSDELLPGARAEGIVIVGASRTATGRSSASSEQRFEREIYPVLTPLAVGPGQPFPYISGLSLSLAVFVRDPETGEERFARVKVPEGLPRFFAVGGGGVFVPLEAVIGALPPCLPADGGRRARHSSGSHATPTSRSPTRQTTCSRRSRNCAAAGSATSSGSRSQARSRSACWSTCAAASS